MPVAAVVGFQVAVAIPVVVLTVPVAIETPLLRKEMVPATIGVTVALKEID